MFDDSITYYWISVDFLCSDPNPPHTVIHNRIYKGVLANSRAPKESPNSCYTATVVTAMGVVLATVSPGLQVCCISERLSFENNKNQFREYVNTKCNAHILQRTTHSINRTDYSEQHRAHNSKCTARSRFLTKHSTQFTTHSAHSQRTAHRD